MDLIRAIIPQIHKEGYYFIIIFLLVTVIMGMLYEPVGWIGIILTLWCIYFFRDPDRLVPIGDKLIVSPADGVVSQILEAPLPKALDIGTEKRIRVSIFLNVFNVHVNRIPAAGKITTLHYHAGKFLNASLDKASEDNERQEVAMTMTTGETIAFTQIAGLIARRIVCNLQENDKVTTGERFGIIRFGSRMDVYLPKGVKPLVAVGQNVLGGETIIADLANKAGRSSERK